MNNISTNTETPVTNDQAPVRFPFLTMVICLALTVALFCLLLNHAGGSLTAAQTSVGIMDKFDRFVTNNIMVELGDHVGAEVERTHRK